MGSARCLSDAVVMPSLPRWATVREHLSGVEDPWLTAKLEASTEQQALEEVECLPRRGCQW
jgi:hypothetical protein